MSAPREWQDAPARLRALAAICNQMAGDIMTARDILRNNAQSPGAAYLACDALDRLGWMADEAACVAGWEGPSAGGVAAEWIFAKTAAKALDELRAASHGRSQGAGE